MDDDFIQDLAELFLEAPHDSPLVDAVSIAAIWREGPVVFTVNHSGDLPLAQEVTFHVGGDFRAASGGPPGESSPAVAEVATGFRPGGRDPAGAAHGVATDPARLHPARRMQLARNDARPGSARAGNCPTPG